MKLYLLILIVGCINSKCLNPETLKQLGWESLSSPKDVKSSSICKGTYSKSRTCVNQDQFSTFMKNYQKELNEKRKDAYEELNDRVKSISEKLKLLKEKIVEKKTFKDKPVNENGLKRLDEVIKWVPENPKEFAAKQKANTKECIRAQNQIALGTFCILSSEMASDYVIRPNSTDSGSQEVKESTPPAETEVEKTGTDTETTDGSTKNDTTTNDISTARRLETAVTTTSSLTAPLVFKVNQNTANYVNTKCSELLRGSCLYKKANEALSTLEGVAVEVTSGCYPELLKCESNPTNCSTKAKNFSLQHFFKPYGDNFLNEKKINSVDTKLINEVGSLWDKTKNKAGSLTDKITDKAGDLADKTGDMYDSLKDKVSSKRRLSNSKNKVAFLLRKLSENQSNEVSYYVTSDGADVVVSGEQSGVPISSLEVYSIITFLSTLFLML